MRRLTLTDARHRIQTMHLSCNPLHPSTSTTTHNISLTAFISTLDTHVHIHTDQSDGRFLCICSEEIETFHTLFNIILPSLRLVPPLSNPFCLNHCISLDPISMILKLHRSKLFLVNPSWLVPIPTVLWHLHVGSNPSLQQNPALNQGCWLT